MSVQNIIRLLNGLEFDPQSDSDDLYLIRITGTDLHVLRVGEGAPSGTPDALVYLRTDGTTDEDTIIYTANDGATWAAADL